MHGLSTASGSMTLNDLQGHFSHSLSKHKASSAVIQQTLLQILDSDDF